jgi:hypothetical protein
VKAFNTLLPLLGRSPAQQRLCMTSSPSKCTHPSWPFDQKWADLISNAGAGEIANLQQRLAATRAFGRAGTAWMCVLHSSVAPEEQRAAFRLPPQGVLRVLEQVLHMMWLASWSSMPCSAQSDVPGLPCNCLVSLLPLSTVQLSLAQ